MKWLVFAAFAIALSAPIARAQEGGASSILNVFTLACSVDAPSSLEANDLGSGVTREFWMRSGAAPGTLSGTVSFAGESYPINTREESDGFCAMRFDPVDAATMRAELNRRFGLPGESNIWRTSRADGDGAIAYRPFEPGQTGPAWINRPNAWMFGYDASEEKDTLVFYAPPVN
jgi:hypothetical protein